MNPLRPISPFHPPPPSPWQVRGQQRSSETRWQTGRSGHLPWSCCHHHHHQHQHQPRRCCCPSRTRWPARTPSGSGAVCRSPASSTPPPPTGSAPQSSPQASSPGERWWRRPPLLSDQALSSGQPEPLQSAMGFFAAIDAEWRAAWSGRRVR